MKRIFKYFFLISILLGFFAILACGGGGGASDEAHNTSLPAPVVLVDKANFPVSLAFAPDGRVFYTEFSTGKIRVIENGGISLEPLTIIPVPSNGNAGLLGIAVDPRFSENHFIYAYRALPDGSRNQVMRLTERNGSVHNSDVILDNLPIGGHDGGRLLFGEDDLLYVTTGDGGQPERSPDMNSLGGKVLRIRRDGSVPDSNPVPGSPVFALGFRNPFGVTRDFINGKIFVTDNGPDCDDEVNLLIPLGNYGWHSNYKCGSSEFMQPLFRFKSRVAPTGLTVYRGDRFPQILGSVLVGNFVLGEVKIFSQTETGLEESGNLLSNEYGSILDVAVSPSGEIYIASINAIVVFK